VKRRISIFILAFASAILCKAVDPQFTQFYSAPLYLSPSFAGATQQNRIAANYRNQWPSIPGGFVTYTLSYDHYFSQYSSGLGFMFMNDYAGTGKYGNSSLNLLYSYDFIVLDQWHIRPGISFVYRTFNLDFARLKFYDQITSSDPSQPTIEQAPTHDVVGHVDGGVSGLVYNSNIWAGLTFDHILKPNQSFFGDKIPTPIKYTFFGGAKLISRGRLFKPLDESISIAYLLKIQGNYKQLDLGFYWYNSPLVLGIWFRGIPFQNGQVADAVAFLVGYKDNHLTVGYSYDFTVSNLINSTGGAHEISLIFEFETKFKKKRHAIPCPQF
jgi:type IX secretion system PorP/SprF family membrane protein